VHVVEHRLERSAGAGSEAASHRGEAGTKETREVGRHVGGPHVRLSVRGSRTGLHTRGAQGEVGEVGQKGQVECARRERVLHIVLEPSHRHLAGTRDPRRVEGLRARRQQEGHEGLRLADREHARVPRLAERGRPLARSLEAEERARLPR
jgi:hypothetical protein